MSTLKVTSARRKKPKTSVGIRCIAVFFLFQALLLLIVVPILWVATGSFYSPIELVALIVFGLGFAVLSAVISVGLFQHRRLARWAAVGASIYMAVGGSVIGIMLFMYLIRPEHDCSFV
jgi:fatty acid desaturase